MIDLVHIEQVRSVYAPYKWHVGGRLNDATLRTLIILNQNVPHNAAIGRTTFNSHSSYDYDSGFLHHTFFRAPRFSHDTLWEA